MCGRYTIFNNTENKEIANILQQVKNKVKPGEIYPTNLAPVILANGVQAFHWGFPKIRTSNVIINARAETASEKRMFKNSLETRRCAIPSTGFYEWKNKQKYHFTLPGNHVLYMAGIYNEFAGVPHFVILTTAANESVQEIHDRMPLVLEKTMFSDWIINQKTAMQLLYSVPPQLQSNAVSKEISLFT